LIFVDAGNVDGTLTWGYGPFTATEDFGNGTECLSKGKAKKCTLAPVGNELRTMPPSSCWLYLGDDSDSCEVWVQGCVPGTRPICPLDMQAMGGWCIDIKANAFASGDEPGAARLWCLKWGRSLCPTHVIMACDAINLSAVAPNSCGDLADDPSVILWTEGTHARSGENTFNHLNCYKGDNTLLSDASCTAGASYPYFCCMPLGGL